MRKDFLFNSVTFWFVGAAVPVAYMLTLAIAGGAATNALDAAALILGFALLSGLVVDTIRIVNARIGTRERRPGLPPLKQVVKKELGVRLELASFPLSRRSRHIRS